MTRNTKNNMTPTDPFPDFDHESEEIEDLTTAGMSPEGEYGGIEFLEDQEFGAVDLFDYLMYTTGDEPDIENVITVFESDFHQLPSSLVTELHQQWYGMEQLQLQDDQPTSAAPEVFVTEYVRWFEQHNIDVPHLVPNRYPIPSAQMPDFDLAILNAPTLAFGKVLDIAYLTGRGIGRYVQLIARKLVGSETPAEDPTSDPDIEQ